MEVHSLACPDHTVCHSSEETLLVSIKKTQALPGQERNRMCSLPSSGSGMPGLGTPPPLAPTVPQTEEEQETDSSRTSLAPAPSFSVWAHLAPIGLKDPDEHAAHIQDETCLSPPRTLSSRPDRSTCGVTGLTGLHSGTVSQKEGSGLGESASPETVVGCNMPSAFCNSTASCFYQRHTHSRSHA